MPIVKFDMDDELWTILSDQVIQRKGKVKKRRHKKRMKTIIVKYLTYYIRFGDTNLGMEYALKCRS